MESALRRSSHSPVPSRSSASKSRQLSAEQIRCEIHQHVPEITWPPHRCAEKRPADRDALLHNPATMRLGHLPPGNASSMARSQCFASFPRPASRPFSIFIAGLQHQVLLAFSYVLQQLNRLAVVIAFDICTPGPRNVRADQFALFGGNSAAFSRPSVPQKTPSRESCSRKLFPTHTAPLRMLSPAPRIPRISPQCH